MMSAIWAWVLSCFATLGISAQAPIATPTPFAVATAVVITLPSSTPRAVLAVAATPQPYTPLPVSTAVCDPDGDGDNDAQWYVPGTCPTHAEWLQNHNAKHHTLATAEPIASPAPNPTWTPTIYASEQRVTKAQFISGQGAWPAAGWVPYTWGPFVQPVPPNPAYAPNSAAIISAMWAGHSSSDVGHIQVYAGSGPPSGGDWSLPVYFGTVTDPVYSIHCTMYGGGCGAEGVQVHIPRGAYPAGGTDHHLTIRDMVTGLDVCTWEAPVPNGQGGTLNVGWGNKLAWDSAGIGAVGCTASGISELWTVRATDLIHNSINHAIMVSVTAESHAIVYPAVGNDNAYFNDTFPPYGAHFWLDVPPPYASSCPQYAVSYLTALNKYGAFFSDYGGTNSPIQPQLESDVSYTSQGIPSVWGPLMSSLGGAAQGNTDMPIDSCGINVPQHLHILAPPAVAVAP